mmetsp:Transcript_20532/g.71049  ORF Transcript_20532/g.71049 Transcript_20532/m.71049 type:complete len:260 (+) Transcript_20532:741-1520(+)
MLALAQVEAPVVLEVHQMMTTQMPPQRMAQHCHTWAELLRLVRTGRLSPEQMLGLVRVEALVVSEVHRMMTNQMPPRRMAQHCRNRAALLRLVRTGRLPPEQMLALAQVEAPVVMEVYRMMTNQMPPRRMAQHCRNRAALLRLVRTRRLPSEQMLGLVQAEALVVLEVNPMMTTQMLPQLMAPSWQDLMRPRWTSVLLAVVLSALEGHRSLRTNRRPLQQTAPWHRQDQLLTRPMVLSSSLMVVHRTRKRGRMLLPQRD